MRVGLRYCQLIVGTFAAAHLDSSICSDKTTRARYPSLTSRTNWRTRCRGSAFLYSAPATGLGGRRAAFFIAGMGLCCGTVPQCPTPVVYSQSPSWSLFWRRLLLLRRIHTTCKLPPTVQYKQNGIYRITQVGRRSQRHESQ